MVANGLGVTILSDMVPKQSCRLIRSPPMDVGLSGRRNAHFTPVMEAFRSYFRQTFFIPTVR